MKILLNRHFRRWSFALLPLLATAFSWGMLRRDFTLWRDGTPSMAYPLPAFIRDGPSVLYSYEVEGLEYQGEVELSRQDLAMLEELHDQPLPILYSAHNPSISGQPGAGGRLLIWILAMAAFVVLFAMGNTASGETATVSAG